MLAFLRAHPRLLCLFAIAAAGGVGYTAGRLVHPAPSHVEARSHAEEKVQAVQLADVKAAEKVDEKIGKKVQKTVRKVRTEFRPDGTVSARTETVSGTTATTEKDRHEDRHDDSVVTTHSSSSRVDDTSRVLDFTHAPNWAVRAFGELELVGPAPMVGGIKAATPLLLYGVTVDRRLWGPLWIGVGGGGTYDLRTRSNGWWVGVSASVVFTF